MESVPCARAHVHSVLVLLVFLLCCKSSLARAISRGWPFACSMGCLLHFGVRRLLPAWAILGNDSQLVPQLWGLLGVLGKGALEARRGDINKSRGWDSWRRPTSNEEALAYTECLVCAAQGELLYPPGSQAWAEGTSSALEFSRVLWALLIFGPPFRFSFRWTCSGFLAFVRKQKILKDIPNSCRNGQDWIPTGHQWSVLLLLVDDRPCSADPDPK